MKIYRLLLLLLPVATNAQQADTISVPVYQYYFIEGRPTGKLQIEVWPEKNAVYPDIDSLVCGKREKNKTGVEEVTGKVYNSFTDFFNQLSRAGLEFVNYYKWNTAGGATGLLVGPVFSDYFIFRKRVK